MAGVEILVTNKVIMSKAAKQSVDAMLAQGKQIRSTSSGAVILKGDGARDTTNSCRPRARRPS